jgi:RNA polymerase sigma-70 factor (ECF subfamily)
MPDRDMLADCVEAIARDQDRKAFATLFETFAPRVKAYMMRFGTAPGLAEDLAQDVMLTVWRRAETFDRRQAAVSTWIFTIARNRRIDVFRREKRPEFDPNDPAFQPDAPIAADEQMSVDERDRRLRLAVQELPAEQIDLLQRAFYSDKSHSEIAIDTGIPLGTVKSRLRLAFQRLRKVLEEGE